MQEREDAIWDIHEPLPVSSSALYHLEPIGVGTPHIESLTSFLKRLAQLHHLTVGTLVAFCSEQTAVDLMPSTIHKLMWIDGITPFAEKWAQLIADLTCQNAVTYLTLASWKKLLTGYRLLRYHQAWCPQCYATWARNEQPVYEPLLWRLQSVATCPAHQRQLVDACPACSQQFVAITARGAVGFCAKCRAWLGDESPPNTVVSDPEADRLSQTIGRFLALAPQTSQFDIHAVGQTIERLHNHRRMPYSQIDKALQIGLNTLRDLRRGQTLPTLNALARLTWSSDASPLEILTNSANDEAEHSKPSLARSKSEAEAYLNRLLGSEDLLPAFAEIARCCGLANAVELGKAFPEHYQVLRERMNREQQQALQNVLVTEPVISVAELARQRGEHQADLYRNFPELCKQVMRAYQEQHEARCSEYLQELLRSDRVVSIRAVAKALGIGQYYLELWFPDELQLLKARTQLQRQQQAQQIQQDLETALASPRIPPIALAQVATELGVSEKMLKKRFPSQSHKILERRRAFQTAQAQAACDRIKQIVVELHGQNIYPGVDRVHAAIGTWMVHGTAYRNAYVEVMLACGYRDVSNQTSLRRYIST
jgi:AraC-like DNA-binding protein